MLNIHVKRHSKELHFHRHFNTIIIGHFSLIVLEHSSYLTDQLFLYSDDKQDLT